MDPRVLLLNILRKRKPRTPLTDSELRYLNVMRRAAEIARAQTQPKN